VPSLFYLLLCSRAGTFGSTPAGQRAPCPLTTYFVNVTVSRPLECEMHAYIAPGIAPVGAIVGAVSSCVLGQVVLRTNGGYPTQVDPYNLSESLATAPEKGPISGHGSFEDGSFEDGSFDDGLFDDGLFDDGFFDEDPSRFLPGLVSHTTTLTSASDTTSPNASAITCPPDTGYHVVQCPPTSSGSSCHSGDSNSPSTEEPIVPENPHTTAPRSSNNTLTQPLSLLRKRIEHVLDMFKRYGNSELPFEH
jgi:hypothetical protein